MTKLVTTTLCCAMALTFTLATDAFAHHTYFTFTQSVELPGDVTLPPGRYEFRVAELLRDRRVVEVWDAKGQTLHATFMSVESELAGSLPEAKIRLVEGGESQKAAVVVYWEGSGRTALEPVYPKQQATRLSAKARAILATTESPLVTVRQMRLAQVVRSDAAAQPAGTSGTKPTELAGEGGSHPDGMYMPPRRGF